MQNKKHCKLDCRGLSGPCQWHVWSCLLRPSQGNWSRQTHWARKPGNSMLWIFGDHMGNLSPKNPGLVHQDGFFSCGCRSHQLSRGLCWGSQRKVVWNPWKDEWWNSPSSPKCWYLANTNNPRSTLEPTEKQAQVWSRGAPEYASQPKHIECILMAFVCKILTLDR